MTDLEIESKMKKQNITLIAKKLGLTQDDIELYGDDKAKIKLKKYSNKKGKLILVTSINPTPYGEGKTTMSIGICDALNRIGKKAVVVLREPSLGPVFGIKGGATGGGYCQITPSIDINLHFTGDIHAIESANNLLCAAIDNHIYFGNELKFKEVLFNRCMDMNDRSLRSITIGKNLNKDVERDDYFQITTASETMAILCLSKDLKDLKRRLGNILIGISDDNKPIYSRDLEVEEAMTLLLKDAIKPNLVQTLENNPAIIHGGPFANIAHGCNSVIATNLALELSDYVITECGFGSDLGCEKFIDIKCRNNDLKPNLIVLNATIRSLKYNGNCPSDKLKDLSLEYLEKGISNLEAHINIVKNMSDNILVILNKFETDSKEEIDYVCDFCKSMNIEFAISDSYKNGSSKSEELANTIINKLEKGNTIRYIYDLNDSIENKIKELAKKVYNANSVNFSDKAINKIKEINELGFDKLPVCVAKTQYSISDDPKKLGYPKDYEINVSDLRVCTGAEFIVVYMNNVITMPGLSRHPNYENMYIDDNEIKGVI